MIKYEPWTSTHTIRTMNCCPLGWLQLGASEPVEELEPSQGIFIMRLDHLETIRASLEYSVKRIQEFPHQDADQKRDSLNPIIEARDMVRDAIKKLKGSKK